MSSKRLSIIVFACFALSTFVAHPAVSQQVPEPQGVVTSDFEISFPDPVSDEDKKNYTRMPDVDQNRFRDALVLVKSVWASDEFKERVLQEHFQPYRDDDIVNADVLRNITAPHPKLMSFYVCAFQADALASTAPQTHQTCVFDSYLHDQGTDITALVNTISHEYTHTTQAGAYRHPKVSRSQSRRNGALCNRQDCRGDCQGSVFGTTTAKLTLIERVGELSSKLQTKPSMEKLIPKRSTKGIGVAAGVISAAAYGLMYNVFHSYDVKLSSTEIIFFRSAFALLVLGSFALRDLRALVSKRSNLLRLRSLLGGNTHAVPVWFDERSQ
jgi:hypothetical protein